LITNLAILAKGILHTASKVCWLYRHITTTC